MNGPLSISITELLAYCELVGLTNLETREDLFHFLSVLDQIALEDYYKKQKANSKTK